MPKRPQQGPCSVIGCGKPIEIKTYCGTHYRRLWKHGRLELVNTGKQKHPLYRVWHERKLRGGLCGAWLDFATFTRDVGERPSEDHFLERRVPHEDYGPSNFVWKEHLRRLPGESVKAFNSRKWKAQKRRRPDFDKRRHLVRNFGIDEARYLKMLEEQGGRCFICREEEREIDKVRGVPRSLAVDHHKATGIVRDLLCFRCNITFTRLEESAELMRRMADYADRWSDPERAAAALNRPSRILPNQHEIILETEWGPMTLTAAAAKAGLKRGTVSSRLHKGWPLDKLLLPLRRPGRLANKDDHST